MGCGCVSHDPSGAALGPRTTGKPRIAAASDGQPIAQVSKRFRVFAQVVRSPGLSLARRKSPKPRSALGLCGNGHARASAVTNVTWAQAAGRPPSGSRNRMLQAANQLAVPEVVDREVPGSAAENRWRREPPYFCGNCAPDWTESPRRTHQPGCISHPNQTKKPPSHPSLRGAADSSRLPPF